MITLHTVGPYFGLPDSSPFVTKVDMLLKLSGLPYEATVGSLAGAPNGKLPFISDAGRRIADSVLIRAYLESQYGIDFDAALSPHERGVAWAVEKMCDDHLYWGIVQIRWLNPANFEKGPAQFFAPLPAEERDRAMQRALAKVRSALTAHGLGLHGPAEFLQLVKRDLQALAQILADKPYMFGSEPSSCDAVAYPFALGVLCPFFDNELRTYAESFRNLVEYAGRLTQRFYGAVDATRALSGTDGRGCVFANT